MDVATILDELRIPYRRAGEHHHVRQGWIGTECPWCGKSGAYLLGISLRGLYASCWQCGSHSLIDALMALSGLPYGRISDLTKGLKRAYVADAPARGPGKLVTPAGVGPLQPAHVRYLLARGFDPDTLVRLWGLGGIGIVGRLQWRVYIPVHWQGAVVSWTTRAIGDRVAKRYISASPEEEITPYRNLLYGADLCRNGVVAVEGPTDVWAIGPGAAGVTGLVVTTPQVVALSQYALRAVCFDAEPDAQRRARRLCRALAAYPGETHLIKLESGKDAAEADKAEIAAIRRQFLDSE